MGGSMTDDHKPPRRSKTPTDREIESARSREERERQYRARAYAPALGVPIEHDPNEDFTPVHDVLGEVGTPEAKRIIEVLWRHTANMELRSVQRHEASDAAALRRDLDALRGDLCELRTDIVDIRGEDGSNGKLGELGRQVNGWASRRWWLLTFVAGTIVTVLGAAIVFGRWMGSVETDLATLKARPAPRRGGPEPFQMPTDSSAKDLK